MTGLVLAGPHGRVRSMMAIAIAMLGLFACGEEPSGAQPGAETGPCIDGLCLSGLACLSDVCVSPGGDGSGGMGTDGVDPTAGAPTSGDPTTPTTSPPSTSNDTLPVDDTGCVGECRTDDDCSPGETCTDCMCVGGTSDTNDTLDTLDTNDSNDDEDSVGTCVSGQGLYADCVTNGNEACMSAAAGCVVVGEPAVAGSCYYPCSDACECPPPPNGAAVGCDAILAESNDTFCYLHCDNGQQCPAGMACLGGLCLHANILTGYADCVNETGVCDGGTCIVDNLQNVGKAVCAPQCASVQDCPPASGGAQSMCVELGDGNDYCLLYCAAPQNCPAGMVCDPTFSLCMWGLDGIPTYGDCMDATEPCELGGQCLVAPPMNPIYSVCGLTCQNNAQCPPAPGGTAVPTCFGDTCFLNCTNGQTCPAGMTCYGEPGFSYVCVWPD